MPFKLYSRLQREIATSRQPIATGKQWAGTIRNWMSKGVASAEVEGTEILEELQNSLDEKLHRDDLLRYLEMFSPCDLLLQREISDVLRPHIYFVLANLPQARPLPRVIAGKRIVRVLQYREPAFGVRIWLNLDYDPGLFGRFRYWTVTVPKLMGHFPGFDTSQCFTHPADAMAAGRRWGSRVAEHFSQNGWTGGWCSHSRFHRYVLPGGDHYSEWLITAPNFAKKFVGEHFDAANVVAHVRSTERKCSDGRRILLLEEIQSDWNQSLRDLDLGRDVAMRTEDLPDNPFRQHWLDIALRYMLLLAAHRRLDGIAWLPGAYHVERFPWACASGLEAFYGTVVPRAVTRLGKAWGVQSIQTDVLLPGRTTRINKDQVAGDFEVVLISNATPLGPRFTTLGAAMEQQRLVEPMRNELLPMLPISEPLRQDLLRNGLPVMGSIGKGRTAPRGSFGEPRVAENGR